MTHRRTAFKPLAALLPFALLAPAQAATYTVTTLGGESGACAGTTCTTIRAAVAAANATAEADHIVFQSGLRGTVALGGNLVFASNRPVSLSGDSDGDGLPDIRLARSVGGGIVAQLAPNADLVLSHIALVDSGHGVYAIAGSRAELNYATVSGHNAQLGAGIFIQDSHVTLNFSTVSGNVASTSDGAGGGIAIAGGELILNHSTVSGNRAEGPIVGRGGGIYHWGFGYPGKVTLHHSTVVDNYALNSGGGIATDDNGFPFSLVTVVQASILADNAGGDCALLGPAASIGIDHSLVRDGSCAAAGGTNLTGVDPLLGPLQDNGGASLTHFPLPGSPVVDAVNCNQFNPDFLAAVDQRGRPRPHGVRCDSGAVEADRIVVTTTVDGFGNGNGCSLREAVANANGNNRDHPDCAGGTGGDDLIVFAADVPRVDLTQGEIVLGNLSGSAGKLTIDGRREGAADVILDGGLSSRVLLVGASQTAYSEVELTRLTIRNGRDAAGGGLYAWDNTQVDLSFCTIEGNESIGPGGGIENKGQMTLSHCTVSNNQAFGSVGNGGGGGILNRGTLVLRHATVAGNIAWNGQGGGVFNASGQTTLQASLVGGNQGSDCHLGGGSLASSFSLVQGGDAPGAGGCGVGAGVNGNLTGNPLLLPLADNGGATRTHLPQSASPALDAVACALIAGFANAADQRGIAKPQGAQCDIGAVEARQYALSLAVSGGNAQNVVTATPAPVPGSGAVDGCPVGATCAASFVEAADVTLTAQPTPDSEFTGWGGDCAAFAANPVATPTMDQARSCSASFDFKTFALGGTLAGATGAVELTLSATNPTSSQTLDLAANGPFEFATPLRYGSEWSVGVSAAPIGQTCVVDNGAGTLTAPVTGIAVTCSTNTYVVTLDQGGNGTLAIVDPPGIDLDAVPYGTVLTVAATPNAGYDLAQLSGCGASVGSVSPRTTDPITADCTLVARFANQPPGFTAGPAATALIGSGENVLAWATDVRTGNDGADGQQLVFLIEAVSGAGLIAAGPVIDPDGSLRFTPGDSAGEAVFSVRVQDDGGTENGGVDTSDAQELRIAVRESTDLSLAVQLAGPGLFPGQPTAFDLRVGNAGPNAAAGARLRWTPPAGLLDVQWRCEPAASCTPAQGTGEIDATLNLPATGEVAFEVDVAAVLPPPFLIPNSATVETGSGQEDPDPANNTLAWDLLIDGVFRDGFENEAP